MLLVNRHQYVPKHQRRRSSLRKPRQPHEPSKALLPNKIRRTDCKLVKQGLVHRLSQGSRSHQVCLRNHLLVFKEALSDNQASIRVKMDKASKRHWLKHRMARLLSQHEGGSAWHSLLHCRYNQPILSHKKHQQYKPLATIYRHDHIKLPAQAQVPYARSVVVYLEVAACFHVVAPQLEVEVVSRNLDTVMHNKALVCPSKEPQASSSEAGSRLVFLVVAQELEVVEVAVVVLSPDRVAR